MITRSRFLQVLAGGAGALALAGCGAQKAADAGDEGKKDAAAAEPVAVRAAALKGPTAMGLVKFMSEVDAGNLKDEDYSFQILASADEVAPLISKSEADIAAVPANLASVLYNKTSGAVRVIAVNTLGVLYICELGDTVNTVADLRGKTIFSAGKGATPEYALEYVLRANGLDPDSDVTIEWKSEHAECVAALAQDATAIAMQTGTASTNDARYFGSTSMLNSAGKSSFTQKRTQRAPLARTTARALPLLSFTAQSRNCPIRMSETAPKPRFANS